jgi:hypothetical protein
MGPRARYLGPEVPAEELLDEQDLAVMNLDRFEMA